MHKVERNAQLLLRAYLLEPMLRTRKEHGHQCLKPGQHLGWLVQKYMHGRGKGLMGIGLHFNAAPHLGVVM